MLPFVQDVCLVPALIYSEDIADRQTERGEQGDGEDKRVQRTGREKMNEVATKRREHRKKKLPETFKGSRVCRIAAPQTPLQKADEANVHI